MSEPSTRGDDVTAQPAGETNPENQLQPGGQAVEQRPSSPADGDAAAGRATAGNDEADTDSDIDGDVDQSDVDESDVDESDVDESDEDTSAGPDAIARQIRRLERKLPERRQRKIESESRYADLTNRLATLLNVQKDVDTAMKSYQDAYDQLRREDKAYEEYLTFEAEGLKKRLGDEGVGRVDELVEARRATSTKLAQDVATAASDLASAEKERDRVKAEVKERGEALKQWKALAATVTAQHAALKKRRDDVTKARQAGQYGLACWLLRRAKREREDFSEGPRLVAPDQLPQALLDAVTALADAERSAAEAERRLAECKERLAAVTKERDAHEANSEARLRDDLAQVPGTDAVTTGETTHA